MRIPRIWRSRVAFALGAFVTLALVVAAAVANERYEQRPVPASSPTEIRDPGPRTRNAIRCPNDPRLGVYREQRLHVLRVCTWARGDVLSVKCMDDGDVHVGLFPSRRATCSTERTGGSSSGCS